MSFTDSGLLIEVAQLVVYPTSLKLVAQLMLTLISIRHIKFSINCQPNTSLVWSAYLNPSTKTACSMHRLYIQIRIIITVQEVIRQIMLVTIIILSKTTVLILVDLTLKQKIVSLMMMIWMLRTCSITLTRKIKTALITTANSHKMTLYSRLRYYIQYPAKKEVYM